MLVDSHGRQMKKLRLSILDACNLRCSYCMPSEVTFSPKSEWLTANEIGTIATNLHFLGLDEIRVTGGEPTLRDDFIEIMSTITKIGFKSVGITTNGIHLKHHLKKLHEIGCTKFNMSLDSLNRETFKKITGKDELGNVLATLDEALKLGFKIKINMVVMNGVNDHEIKDFINFSAKTGIEVRFLEVMKIGVAKDNYYKWHISADEMINRIKVDHELFLIPTEKDSTSFKYAVSNGAEIGFIASETKPFCGGCSRLRVNHKGEIRPCLMVDHQVSLRGVPVENYPAILNSLIKLKPTERLESVDSHMHGLGG